jgi:AcrR family transcriptional regulator
MASAVVPVEEEARGGPRSRKGEATRARLLTAAKEVFEEQGFPEARISDIAKRAGLSSHGAFYHYFDSKEAIFREVAEELDELLGQPMQSVILAPDSEADPRRRLAMALRQHLESYREEARIMGVIEQVARYDDDVAAVRFKHTKHHREQIARSVRHLQRVGAADPSLDPVIAAAALGAMSERFAEMWLVQGFFDCDLDAAAETLAALMVNALQMTEEPRGGGSGA